VKGTGGKMQMHLFHDFLEQILGVFFRIAELPNFSRHHFVFRSQSGASKAFLLL
jgi:hypothetical protein